MQKHPFAAYGQILNDDSIGTVNRDMMNFSTKRPSEKTWATGKTKDISCNQSSEHNKPELRHISLGE